MVYKSVADLEYILEYNEAVENILHGVYHVDTDSTFSLD